MFSWLFKTPAKCAVVIGDGAFEFRVVGESHHQPIIEKLAGGRSEVGAHYKCAALLVPEPTNPYDRHAVAVEIKGQAVGYLERDLAPEFLKALTHGGFQSAACGTIIVGGWERQSDQGYFGVKLNACLPFQLAEPNA